MDGESSHPSIGDDPDDIPRTRDKVASSEDARDIGLKGFRVNG